MATLLMNLARASRPQNVLQAFEFRGVAPTFVDEPLQVTVLDDGAESLEIRNHDSDLVMSASAEFESTELTS
jgi:hydroxyacyl-ACP dehydratase HTD2-like protein with hotdog domain